MKRLQELKREWLQAVRVGWFLAIRGLRRAGKGTTVLIVFIMVLTYLNLVVVSGLLLGLITGSFQQFRESYSGDVLVTPAPMQSYIKRSQNILGSILH
jgi:hypothetical protein